MAAKAVKHSGFTNPVTYGAERYNLEMAIVGQGAAAPIIQAPSVNGAAGTTPPCAAEIAGFTRTSAGLYVATMFDAYFAVAYAAAEIDDTAGLASRATIGNWTNLQTRNPATFTLYTWNYANSATDIPLNTVVYIMVRFKKGWTGAAA